LSLQPSCVDLLQVAGSPTPASASPITYSVVALYHNHVEPNVEQLSATVSEGPPGTFPLWNPPLVPNVPEKGTLEATTLEGAATLTWKPPVGGEPVVFYRIYRGTQDYTPGRYAVVSAATTTFTDNHAVEKAKYWVTAVSKSMTESPFTASVTLP
jgi:hypothetical protein